MATSYTFQAPNAISQPLKQFMGNNYNGAVCTHIPEIASPLNPAIPLQMFDFAYSTQNDAAGFLPNIPIRTAPNPKLFQTNLTEKSFNVQITATQQVFWESITQQQMFAQSMADNKSINPSAIRKAADVQQFNFIIQSLARQTYTRNEALVFDQVTDAGNYNGANVNASITTAVPAWTQATGQAFLQGLAEGATYLNKLSGNQLMVSNPNEAPEVSTEMELFIIMPRNIYTALVGVWATAFGQNTTLMGFDGKANVGGAFRGLIPALFASATGFYGAKVIIADSYVNESLTNTLDTAGVDFKSIWQGNSVYMFTVSKNILMPASIMKPTYRADSMYQTIILDTNYVKTQAFYDYVSPLPFNYYRIDLTLA